MNLVAYAVEHLQNEFEDFVCFECSRFLMRPRECSECNALLCYECTNNHYCAEGEILWEDIEF